MEFNFKKKYLIFLVMIAFIIIGSYYSYAIFVTKQLQENVVVLKTIESGLYIKVNDSTNKVKINKNSNEEVLIKITNNALGDSYYQTFFVSDASNILVTSDNDLSGIINSNEEKELNVKVTNNNDFDIELTFLAKASLDDNLSKEIGYRYINRDLNYDHSNANKPILNNNLIPVSYKAINDKEGYWYKVDGKNDKDLWYDYDNGIWANAVLVSNSNYKKYQAMANGSEIELDDILGFYVWIPKFKYTILNGNNYTSFERINNIIFEKESSGTVTCKDSISNDLDNHLYSEVCKDNIYNKIYDNQSTYSHPAFNDKEGFWVAKFLMGKGNGLIRSLPNIEIIKKNINDAIDSSNSVLNNKSHLITNMEYASIVMLSNSMYGKSYNKDYLDDNYTFKRVYINNYENNITGCSSDYTIHSKSFITNTSKTCIEYNNLENLSHFNNSIKYSIGSVGPGASTTGTIYGVYDMANIDGELVSSFTVDKSGKININTKYKDIYSYSNYIGKISSSNTIINLNRYKYGDTIKEGFKAVKENGMWQNGTLEQKTSVGVFLRGGNSNIKNSSIYTTSIVDFDYLAPFRVVIK